MCAWLEGPEHRPGGLRVRRGQLRSVPSTPPPRETAQLQGKWVEEACVKTHMGWGGAVMYDCHYLGVLHVTQDEACEWSGHM